jgi:hypothetical protein
LTDKKEHAGSEEEEGDTSSLTAASNLPMRWGWFVPLFRLQGCWLTQQCVESVKLVHAQFKPRPDDLLLVTYPKCGTSWLKALTFTVARPGKKNWKPRTEPKKLGTRTERIGIEKFGPCSVPVPGEPKFLGYG